MKPAPQARPLDAEPLSRRARKKERTRREIFDAAMALFEARGFDAVTVEAICEAADVARGTFFLHFPTKAALLYEFSNQVAAEFAEKLAEPRPSARDELVALVEHMAERLAARPDVMLSMIREFWSAPEAVAVARERGRDFPDLIEEIVRRGQERGEFRGSVDARLASAVLLSTAAAILSGNVFAEGELDLDEIRRQFFEVTFHGLVAPEPKPGREST